MGDSHLVRQLTMNKPSLSRRGRQARPSTQRKSKVNPFLLLRELRPVPPSSLLAKHLSVEERLPGKWERNSPIGYSYAYSDAVGTGEFPLPLAGQPGRERGGNGLLP
ncbi:hypothetical protein ACOSP7_017157 [Xanthoceras sorbifolium]